MNVKQRITINGIRTTTSRAIDTAKARQWLDNLQQQWTGTLGTGGLNTATSVVRESADKLVVVTDNDETIIIDNIAPAARYCYGCDVFTSARECKACGLPTETAAR